MQNFNEFIGIAPTQLAPEGKPFVDTVKLLGTLSVLCIP